MKRAPIVLTATAAGLAATLGFNAVHHAGTTAVTTTSSPASSPATTSSPNSSGTRAITSGVASTQYGNVQLRVTMTGGRITDIQPLQLPSNDQKSVEIASYAAPLLRQSALQKQSANVDVVSGATYTSEGYRAALQSVLDKAGVASRSATSSGTTSSGTIRVGGDD